MQRCTSWAVPFFAIMVVGALASPTVIHAQTAQISPGQMHAEFERAGLIADPITDWWTGDASTFTVVDPRETGWRGRVLFALVYRDAGALAAARQQASSREGMLVPGYGEASWLGNVALVQSSPYELGELAEAERERAQALNSPLPGDPTVAVRSLYTVDQEFLDVVYQAVGRIDL